MKHINYLKTLYYNYRFFGLQGLVHLPLIVHSSVIFRDTQGKITLSGKARRGMLRFGSDEPLATRDMRYERTVIDISGELIVADNVHIAAGSRISIGEKGQLRLGKNFNSTGNCTIICDSEINIGDDCLLAWDIQIMDADFHKIFDSEGRWINQPGRIDIGNHVWICSRASLLKGTTIADGCVVGAGSTVSKPFTEKNCVIAGSGSHCRVVRKGISWQA